MTIPYLSVELTFDLIAVCLGIACIVRSGDNLPRRWWGFITVLIGLAFIYENVEWLCVVSKRPEYRFEALLEMDKMMEFYIAATVIGFFPMASLRPGFLNVSRVLPYLVPSIIVITMGTSYLAFNGHTTTLATLADVWNARHYLDVRLRLTVFLFSVTTPLLCFFYPFVCKRKPREGMVERVSVAMMNYFKLAVVGLVAIYVCFTLCINYFIFNFFGAACIAFVSIFAILYLRYESPFAAPLRRDDQTEDTVPTLLKQIESQIVTSESYASADLSLSDIAEAAGIGGSDVSAAIKSAGYSGFREYIVCLRLQMFRRKAMDNPHKSVKELMYACGFTSRSAFYRAFANYYASTPTDFIHSLCTEE